MPSPPEDGSLVVPYYYTLEDLREHAATQGLTEQEDNDAIERTTRILSRVYRRLKIPLKTYATASYLLHRFYAYWPRKSPDYVEEEICIACLDLACKLRETPIGIPQLAQYVLYETRGDKLNEEEAKAAMEGKIPPRQRKILESVQCDTHVVHPFAYLVKFTKKLEHVEPSPKLLNTFATTILLDSYRIPACILFPPHLLAMAALYLTTMLLVEVDVTPKVDVSFWETCCCWADGVEDAALMILEMYMRKQPADDDSAEVKAKYGQYQTLFDSLQDRIKNRLPPAEPAASPATDNHPHASPHDHYPYASPHDHYAHASPYDPYYQGSYSASYSSSYSSRTHSYSTSQSASPYCHGHTETPNNKRWYTHENGIDDRPPASRQRYGV